MNEYETFLQQALVLVSLHLVFVIHFVIFFSNSNFFCFYFIFFLLLLMSAIMGVCLEQV